MVNFDTDATAPRRWPHAAMTTGTKTNVPQTLYLVAWVFVGLLAGAIAAFVPLIFGAINEFELGIAALVGAVVGLGIGKLLLMLIRHAALDPEGRLVDSRGRMICEHPCHPLAFSLRTLFVFLILSAIAAALARKLLQDGELAKAMNLTTPLIALAGGFLWLYSKQRGSHNGLLVFVSTSGTMLVWLICSYFVSFVH